MIADRVFNEVMEQWSDWCKQGGIGLRAYPTSSAFVHDYVDHVAGSCAPVDDYPMMAGIDGFVASTSQIDERIPMVLVAHWVAGKDWMGTSHALKLKRLSLTENKYYKLLDKGNYSVRGAISGKYIL